MLNLFIVQKLLNLSHIKPQAAFQSLPAPGQMMDSWYVSLFSTGFLGKLMVIYVHQPSLLTVVCPGKTIRVTYPVFLERLSKLLARFDFPEEFIHYEIQWADEYECRKTESKSMLAHINQIIPNLEHHARRSPSYDDISLDFLEDVIMDYLFQGQATGKRYVSPWEWWKEKLNRSV